VCSYTNLVYGSHFIHTHTHTSDSQDNVFCGPPGPQHTATHCNTHPGPPKQAHAAQKQYRLVSQMCAHIKSREQVCCAFQCSATQKILTCAPDVCAYINLVCRSRCTHTPAYTHTHLNHQKKSCFEPPHVQISFIGLFLVYRSLFSLLVYEKAAQNLITQCLFLHRHLIQKTIYVL